MSSIPLFGNFIQTSYKEIKETYGTKCNRKTRTRNYAYKTIHLEHYLQKRSATSITFSPQIIDG